MIIPRVGQRWEFYPTIGKKHKTIKTITAIYWRTANDGKAYPTIQWSHTPKARYIPHSRVKTFLAKKAIRLLPPAPQPRRLSF